MSLISFFNSRKNDSRDSEGATNPSSDHTSKREWREILSRWETVAASAPDDPEAGIQVVNAHIQLENQELATSKLRELEALHPNNLQVMSLSARLLTKFGDKESTRKKWEEIAEVFSSELEPCINLTQFALQEDNLELAMEWSEKSLAIKGDDIRSLMLRAKIEQRQENWEKALELWKHVNKVRGVHYESELQIALCLLKLGRNADALTAVEESLQHHSRVSSFLQIKYKALLRLDQRDEALAVIDQLLESDIENNDYLLEKSRVCLQLGRLDQSEEACRLALKKEPDNVQLLTLYARIGQKRVGHNAAA